MKESSSRFPSDRTEKQRRKDLSEQQVKDLELAGGVEGGMQAGSAGGPGEEQIGQEKGSAKARADDSEPRSGR